MADPAPSLPRPAVALRAARLEQGLSLRALSAKTGLPYSTLSKLETGRIGLTYDKLWRLAQGLGIDVGAIVTDPAPQLPKPSVIGRRSVARAGSVPPAHVEHKHHYPAAELLGKLMEPAIIEVRARSVDELGGLLRHEGEEYLYVLSGMMELHSDLYAPLRLDTGDSVYFDSGMAHAYVRVGDDPCQVLSVMAGAGIRSFAQASRDAMAVPSGENEREGRADG